VLESFGIVYYEALAFGRPVVAVDRGFAREACGEAARYAEIHDGEAFADGVSRLMLDKEASERARARFREVDVPWSAIASRFLDVLEAT
jgi:glycosyltransferase involved in cell wall biosynthesis